MEADDCSPSAGGQAFGNNAQCFLKFLQLPICRNAQSLKSTRCRVNALTVARVRHRAAHELGQLTSGFYRRGPSGFDHPPCDAPAVSLFTILVDDVGQVFFRQSGHPLPGWFALADIETQVERSVAFETESAT